MPTTLALLTPPPGIDAFFRPLAAEMGIRHGLADSASLFTLAIARWAPIFSLTPFLGGRLVPNPVKMGLTMLFGIVMLPSLSASATVPLAMGAAHWWSILLKEVFVGFCLGFAASLLFWSAEMGGKFLDNVRGTTTANLMIPQVQVQSSLLGDFYFQLFIVLYIAAGGHILFLSAVFDSYTILPALSMGFSMEAIGGSFVIATGNLFVVTLKIIAPALVVLMLLDLILGVANRMSPQLDVFFISLSLKATIGALIVALSLYYLLSVTPQVFDDFHRWFFSTLKYFTPLTEGGG